MKVLIGATFRRQSPQTQFAAAPAASAPHATASRKHCFVAGRAAGGQSAASGLGRPEGAVWRLGADMRLGSTRACEGHSVERNIGGRLPRALFRSLGAASEMRGFGAMRNLNRRLREWLGLLPGPGLPA
jgi:hypothetical protein